MKKITTTIKTMFLAVVVLVMAQGCIPNSDVVNPTVDLTGKIKSSTFTTNISNSMKLNYFFNYDDTGKLDNFKLFVSNPAIDITYNIEYQTNKFIFKDSASSGKVYHLHAGTNLIDSIDIYNSGQKGAQLFIERDVENNLVSITLPNTISITDFVYQNGNLISYHLKFYYWGFLAEDIYYELTYDFSMPKKTGVDPYSILTGGFSFIADFAPFDVENFGLSIGNININALLSVSWIKVSTDIPGGGGDGTINYTYPIYTPTTSITLLTGEGTGGYNCSKVENSYY